MTKGEEIVATWLREEYAGHGVGSVMAAKLARRIDEALIEASEDKGASARVSALCEDYEDINLRLSGRLALAERVVEAARVGLIELEGIWRDGRVPRACGACGTPDGACDGDCVSASYLARDIGALRKALAAWDAKEGSGG